MSTDVMRHEADELSRLRKELEAAKQLICDRLAYLDHRQKTFERASKAAKVGVFECSLPDERLEWSEAVFDIFDLPYRSRPDRQATLECYARESRIELQQRRSRAIAESGSFSLDAEIVTPKGNRRWMRITAEVESQAGVPIRLFGLKQDITEEKLLFDRTRYLAEFDAMTDLANRSRFQAALSQFAIDGSTGQLPAALLVIDLDGFKAINDTYGHAAGDACLKEIARRLRAECRNADLVARIGGDEFAVMLRSDVDSSAAANAAKRIIEAISRPLEFGEIVLRLGASIGIALAEDCAARELYVRADIALYAAKAAGRNCFRIYERSLAANQRFALPSAGEWRIRIPELQLSTV